jgi:hypothetical protein
VGHGELWCAQLTAAKCRQLGADCAFMDTREVLVVRPTADGNSVDVEYEVGGCWADRGGRWLMVCWEVGVRWESPAGGGSHRRRSLLPAHSTTPAFFPSPLSFFRPSHAFFPPLCALRRSLMPSWMPGAQPTAPPGSSWPPASLPRMPRAR